MMIPENTLNAEDVRAMMLDVMEKHLSLKTEGYRSTTHETFNLLLKAVAAAIPVGHLGLHATSVYLDKGFCSGELIRHLQRVGQAAVLACPIWGKTGGIRALCQGRGSYTTDYTFTDGTTVRLALVYTRVHDPKTKRK